jgi:hypothetical protein
MSQGQDWFEDFNTTSKQGPDETNAPNLSHLDNRERQSPPSFQLVPDCHFVSLFLVAMTLTDPDDIFSSLYFSQTKLSGTVDMSGPLTKFLQHFHCSDESLLELLPLSTDFFDRSATRHAKFPEFEELLERDFFFPLVLSATPEKSTFESWKDELFRTFFETQSGALARQRLIRSDGIAGSLSIREAIRIFPGGKHLFKETDVAFVTNVLEGLNDQDDQNDLFCLWLIGTFESRMTLVIILGDNFYMFSDRSTVSYDKSDDFGKIEQMRIYLMGFAGTRSVRTNFAKVVRLKSKMTYLKSVHNPMREFITGEVSRAMARPFTFCEFVEEAVQRPAIFVAKYRDPLGIVPVPEYGFALEVVCEMTHSWTSGDEHIEFLKGFMQKLNVRDPEFIDNVAKLFNAYVAFTNFVYRLMEFVDCLGTGIEGKARMALYPLCGFIPFELELPFVCVVRYLTKIARDRVNIYRLVEEALAVMIEPGYFRQVETQLPSPEEFDGWSKRLPSHLFTIEGLREPLGITQAIRRFRELKGRNELDELGKVKQVQPVVRTEFKTWVRQAVGPAIWI